ncbi:MAG: FecR family protein [Burkholderiales bacterium]
MKRAIRIGFGLAGFLALALLGTAALGAGAGTVAHLSGTLSVQRSDGSVRILGQRSEVHAGDVLTTQRDSYAQISFTDGSSLTMRPNTQIRVERYHFVQDQPQDDSTLLRLVKGGMRTVTGLVGKRGNPDAYQIGTRSASIGIRGSSGDTVDNTSGGCDGAIPGCEKLPAGVYHATYTGSYIMRNERGSQIIGEGQFGYARDLRSAPALLPGNPGLNLNQLPIAMGVGGRLQSPGEDCVVR